MLRYLTVTVTIASALLACTGTGCSNKAEPRKPAGDTSAVADAKSAKEASTAGADTASQPASKEEKSHAGVEASQAGAAGGDGGGAKPDAAAEQQLDPAVTAQVQPLLEQMASDASLERQAAAESLDGMGSSVMPYIAAALVRGTDAQKRGAAAFLIGRVTFQDVATFEALVAALGPDDVLRHSALQAVEKLPDEQLGPALAALAALAENTQEETAYRVRAVRAIAKLDAAGRAAAPDLLQLARDDATPDLQRSAIDAIGKVASPEESEAFFLEVLRSSPQKDVRQLAARRLIQAVQSEKAIVGLIAAFSDAEVDVRNEAIEALVAIGRPAVPELIKALDDPNVQIRRRSVVTLGKLNTLAAEAVPALQKKLQDTDPEVRLLAAASLKLIQGQ